jgi:hypothetical protein
MDTHVWQVEIKKPDDVNFSTVSATKEFKYYS